MASCISSELGEYPHGVTGLGLGGIALPRPSQALDGYACDKERLLDERALQGETLYNVRY